MCWAVAHWCVIDWWHRYPRHETWGMGYAVCGNKYGVQGICGVGDVIAIPMIHVARASSAGIHTKPRVLNETPYFNLHHIQSPPPAPQALCNKVSLLQVPSNCLSLSAHVYPALQTCLWL